MRHIANLVADALDAADPPAEDTFDWDAWIESFENEEASHE